MYRKILVVLSSQSTGQPAVRQAVAIARTLRAGLLLLYPLPCSDFVSIDLAPVTMELQTDAVREQVVQAKKVLENAQRLAEQFGVPSRYLLAQKDDQLSYVLDVLKQRKCDLVVISTEPSNAVQRLFNGSLVPGLITRSPVPVLVCRDEPPARSAMRRDLRSIQARERKLFRLGKRGREK